MYYISNNQEIILIYSSLCIKTPFQIQEKNNFLRWGAIIILNRLHHLSMKIWVVCFSWICNAEILVHLQNIDNSKLTNQ